MRFLPLLLALVLAACADPAPPPAPSAEAALSTSSADESTSERDPGHGEGEHEEELAPYMASLQRYAEKLYLAGTNENWELAHFYEHELEEVATEVVEGGFEDDGYDVSGLVQSILLPAVEDVEAATSAQSAAAFETSYRALLGACNECHAATEHGFIKLQVPSGNPYPSQDFSL